MIQKYKPVILLVDDREVNRFALEQLLEGKDRVVLHADNGKEALHMAVNESIDLIILDVQMPEMDGFEVAQLLRSNKKTREIPIIFASAERTEHRSMMKGFEEGAIDYLFKPLDPEVVKAKVNVQLKIQLQKRELIAINSSLQKSALLINNSADIIGVIDGRTLKIEEMNPAFTTILGYEQQEYQDIPLITFLTDEVRPGFMALARGSKDHFSLETGVNCKDQSIKWLQWKVVCKDHKWFMNARDITDIRIADEQIKQLNKDLQGKVSELEFVNKELESFSYSVSHDLRAPLRALTGYSQMLEEDHRKILSEQAQKMLSRIQYNARKMGTLIDDLLAFSRLGRKEVQKKPTDMQAIVALIISDIEHIAAIKATINIGALPPANADTALMQHVWTNLITNAIKYSDKKEQPQIEIGATKAENGITYYIKDNGAGFDMAYADKLFGVFQRMHSNKEFEGSGIGLAIVHRIITRHSGQIWAEAEVNKGAAFYFTLPNDEKKDILL